MGILRAPRPDDHFTQIRNDTLRDDSLSYRARGLLASILSRPDDWATSAEALARSGSEGRDAIRTALTELETAGYLQREKRQDSKGRWATQSIVYDTPQVVADVPLFVVPAAGFQASVNQPSVSQAPIEQRQEQSSPDGEERADEKPEAIVAKAVYDAASGMVPFMGMRNVAARALKVKGATTENVTAAMIGLWREGRPLTLQTVGQSLARTGYRDTNQDHWAKGGEF